MFTNENAEFIKCDVEERRRGTGWRKGRC